MHPLAAHRPQAYSAAAASVDDASLGEKMPRISEYYFRVAILFLILGIGIGISMAMTENHNVIGAHAHINLLGWVTSALFGGYFALNPAKAAGRLPMIQFGIYIVGVVLMTGGLYFMLAGNAALFPLVAAGSLISFAGVLLFAWILWMPARNGATALA